MKMRAGPGLDSPGSFGALYEEQRILRMVRDHRSHPALIIYSVQNELGRVVPTIRLADATDYLVLSG